MRCDLSDGDRVVDKLEAFAYVIPAKVQAQECLCILPEVDSIAYMRAGDISEFAIRLVKFDDLKDGIRNRDIRIDIVDPSGSPVENSIDVEPAIVRTGEGGFADVVRLTVRYTTPTGRVFRIRLRYLDKHVETSSYGPFIYVQGP